MVKQVSGYLTSDGLFCETKEAAAKHESLTRMRKVLADSDMSEDILSWLDENRLAILDYLDPTVGKEEASNERRNIQHIQKPRRV